MMLHPLQSVFLKVVLSLHAPTAYLQARNECITYFYPTNIASVNLVMGCSKVFFLTILTPALAY